MKPNKLYFKGAWMNFNSGPAKVTGFTNEGVHFTDRFGYGISSGADPIPLTPEILEKNGFTHYGESWYIQTKNETIMVGFFMYNTIIHVEKKGQSNFFREISYGYRSTIKHYIYVHELQAAMRLCGIEKEIEI